MKISFIIFILSIIYYISCSINLIDINLSTDYIIDTNDKTLYPNHIIPKNSIFYFRLQDIGELNKILYLKSNSEINSFIVKVCYFNETPHESEIEDDENWEEFNVIQRYDNNIYYILIYLRIHKVF